VAMFLSMFAAVVFATYVAHRQFPPVLVVAALLVLLSIRILLLSGSGPELRLAIHALEFIESRTPTGTIRVSRLWVLGDWVHSTGTREH